MVRVVNAVGPGIDFPAARHFKSSAAPAGNLAPFQDHGFQPLLLQDTACPEACNAAADDYDIVFFHVAIIPSACFSA